eukprot:XP_022273688.1 peroxisomal leader peptide-processing protease [Canis lupus familiaris]
MARQWGPSLRAAEKAGCVVSASRAGQPAAGSWSCSGVIVSRGPDLVLCHGGILTPFLRAGSAALTAAGAAFLRGDSCGDDLRLHVQWGPAAASPAGGAERGRAGLCTPQCSAPQLGWKARECLGLTLLCAAAPLLRAARAALGRPGPGAPGLAALLPPEVGAPWGLPLRAPGPPWAAAAVLVECGAVWGSGVAVAPRLVVTCRHVAPREAARVLVRATPPKSAMIWGHVVFATQETSPYDIAVVSLEEDLQGIPLPVPTEHFHEGEAVSVVGFGVFGQACGPSVTSGILSAVVRVDDTPVMLQTTCAVHGGSSGGPLFSTCTGDLLGIVASNTRDNNTGATYPHLNFSVPVTVLQPALQRYRQTGDLGGLRELDGAVEPVKVVWRLQRPLTKAPRSKL